MLFLAGLVLVAIAADVLDRRVLARKWSRCQTRVIARAVRQYKRPRKGWGSVPATARGGAR